MLTISDVKVVGIVPDTIPDERTGGIEAVRVYYNIAEFGPYGVLIPKVEMSGQRVLMDIRQDAQKYLDVLNLTF